jgi:hypothetical protein
VKGLGYICHAHNNHPDTLLTQTQTYAPTYTHTQIYTCPYTST